MNLFLRIRRAAVCAIVSLFLVMSLAGTLRAAEAAGPTITPEAKAVIEQVRDAYLKLHTLEASGTMTIDMDVAGKIQADKMNFTSFFAAPQKFVHTAEGGITLGSTGEELYLFAAGDKVYAKLPAIKDRTAGNDLPEPLGSMLSRQNPSLVLAISPDAGAELLDSMVNVEKAPDAVIDGVAYTTLKGVSDAGVMTEVAIDSKTHLLRRVSLDLKKSVEEKGAPNVKKANVVFDYPHTTVDPTLKADQFAWTAPADAREISVGDRSALEGKDAPDFELPSLDGQQVKLSALKGSVVVLDFWATWCPPCRQSLPHLDELNEKMKDKGVKVFAVNSQEEGDTVRKFVKDTKLTTTVLLDEKGITSEPYNLQAIPQTVVIGKDGKVVKVFTGFNPNSSPQQLLRAVNKALEAK